MRNFLAVVVGFGVSFAVWWVLHPVVIAMHLHLHDGQGHWAQAVMTLIASVIAGYLAALIATSAHTVMAAITGLIWALMFVIEATKASEGVPVGALVVTIVLPIPLAILGAWIAAKQRGSKPATV